MKKSWKYIVVAILGLGLFVSGKCTLSKSENSKTEKLMPFEEIKVNAAPVVWKKEVSPFFRLLPLILTVTG